MTTDFETEAAQSVLAEVIAELTATLPGFGTAIRARCAAAAEAEDDLDRPDVARAIRAILNEARRR